MEMTERPRERQEGGPAGLGDPFAPAEPGGGLAVVAHGPYSEALPVHGMSVEQIRRCFGDLLDLDPQSTPILDGQEARNDTVVRAGQVLLFTRRAGEKGTHNIHMEFAVRRG